MFTKVLIANRGAIACRIIRTLKKMGVGSVAVYSEADAHSLHVIEADEAYCIGPASASESYLCAKNIFAVAKKCGAQAIHPGFGFLSENAEFSEACAREGIVFMGPTPQQMRDFGLKHTARALAELNGVPMLPGSDLLPDIETARKEASRIGYPVILKSTAGGGGIGMRVCQSEKELVDTFESVRRLAGAAFSEAGVFVEKFVAVARHIEVQVFGDGKGEVVALGERDCSAQRRNQKVLEETPAPGLSDSLRAELHASAIRLAKAVGYQSAGTVEFLFDAKSLQFYFLEMNTRLQVEHGVTEEVTGVDLVEWMVLQAAGELNLSGWAPTFEGASIQARLYAEDPNKDFQPSSGILTEVAFPENVRVETWVEQGSEVPSHYDPMLAKIIVKAEDREAAVGKLEQALAATRIAGIVSNLEYLQQICGHEDFHGGNIHTKWLATMPYRPSTIDVLEPGTQSSIQDYPGRVGYWSIGVPPSGPMDDYAFRIANSLVGNDDSAAALELTLMGPTLKFNMDTTIALTGARMKGDLDGNPIDFWSSVHVRAGSVLQLRGIEGAGCRTYLAVKGGFDVPDYLGSKSTFSLGKFGGHAGRFLTHGDVLRVNRSTEAFSPLRKTPADMVPSYAQAWDITVLYGPHAAPDFFTEEFIDKFFNTDWKVHYNSNRLGIRLLGPKPEFARTDGGEAGLHPSNIHDTEYAIGTINFTGDMPVILAKDGPSLGGFVCPVTIVKSELWKIGQLRPGDHIRFVRTSYDEAVAAEKRQDSAISKLDKGTGSLAPQILTSAFTPEGKEGAVLHQLPANGSCPGVVYRMAGDKYLLLEYGPLHLDPELRFRVHALMEWLKANPVEGILELSPGVRSLQINYDSRILPVSALLEELLRAEVEMPPIDSLELPTRIVNMPLAFDASTTRQAIAKYQQSVRSSAPWLPSNVEFIRRINGLPSVESVEETIFKASYMVFGLGDVYLGAPCAVPIDPRHRLVTTKYNPARTWTAENAVGIAGAYLCIYGMEGPGGYQFVGRTLQMWNRYRQTAEFESGKPWLLRFFDQIQFYPVSSEELTLIRKDFVHGRYPLKIEHSTFRLREHQNFVQRHADSIRAFKQRQQNAFEAERESWAARGQDIGSLQEPVIETEEFPIPEGCSAVETPVPGSIWKLLIEPNTQVETGQPILIVESMKTEITIPATKPGILREFLVEEGQAISAGQKIAFIEKV